jgi:hypothetical protein
MIAIIKEAADDTEVVPSIKIPAALDGVLYCCAA